MYKKLLALLLALITVLGVVTAAASAAVTTSAPVADAGDDDDDDPPDDEYVEVSPDGKFRFRVSDDSDEAYLMEYLGNDASVVIPSSVSGYTVTRIWDSAFRRNASRKKITSITLPEGIEQVSSGVFSSIPNVRDICVPASVKNFIFDGNDIKSTAWYRLQAKGVIYLGSIAVGYQGAAPAALTLKAGTTAIKEDAFAGMTGVRKLSIPTGVTYIGSCAFVGCLNLKDAVIPKSVTYIGGGAFGFKRYEWVDKYVDYAEDDDIVLETEPVSGFTLYGFKGSAAQAYAAEAGVRFEYLVSQPRITGFQNVAGGTAVYWNKVAGAKYYRVFGMSAKGWQVICKKTAKTSFTYMYKKPVSGRYYRYTVRAISSNGSVFTSSCNLNGWKYRYIAPPGNVKAVNVKKGVVKVTWSRPKGAKYFAVFRRIGSGKWTKCKVTSALSFTDRNRKKGTVCRYTVRVINSSGNKYLSGYSRVETIKCR